MKNFIGVDIGGMTIKGIIVDGDGVVKAEGSIVTGCEKGGDEMCNNICTLIKTMLGDAKLENSQISGVGIGCPGLIDSKNGVVVFAGNLNLKNFPLAEKVRALTGFEVKTTNDANAAALGEAKFGAGKQYNDSILVTLGTGVGGGIVIDGELFEGGKSAGTEIGHMVIVENGLQCTCGRKGCYERYASASALMEQTRLAMEENKDSLMWSKYNLQTVSGKTPFEFAESDAAANSVVNGYIQHLACGITNLANIFRPQVVMLGGGVSEQGERLTIPLQKILDADIMGGTEFAPVKVVKAALGSRAGAFGAAALGM